MRRKEKGGSDLNSINRENSNSSHSQTILGLAAIADEACCDEITSAAWAEEDRKPAKSTSARKRRDVSFVIVLVSLSRKVRKKGAREE